MSNYGVKVFNDNGSSYVFDENSHLCAILGSISSTSFTPYPNEFKTNIYIPSNCEYYVSFTSRCFQVIYNLAFENDFKVIALVEIESYLSEDREVILRYSKNSWRANSTIYVAMTYFTATVYIWSKGSDGRYGISVSGRDNFSSIDEKIKWSYVSYKGDITLTSDGWDVKSIDKRFDFDKTLVFFYWENPNVSIVKWDNQGWWGPFTSSDQRPNKDKRYVPIDNNNDGRLYQGKLNCKVVIFDEAAINQSQYGMQLFSDKGQLVFDSSTEILINPVLFSAENFKEGELTKITNIQRPMVIPTQVGALAPQWNKNSHSAYDYYLTNSGQALGIGRMKVEEARQYRQPYDDVFISDLPNLVLDATNYFKF